MPACSVALAFTGRCRGLVSAYGSADDILRAGNRDQAPAGFWLCS